MRATAANAVEVARQLTYIREAQQLGQNRGQRVEGLIAWGGGSPGDSWCCFLATWVLDFLFRGKSPIPRTGSCEVVLEIARARGLIVSSCRGGDLFIFVGGDGRAHHIGFVTIPSPMTGVAGNTSPDGKSSNGDGCYEHEIIWPQGSSLVFVRPPYELDLPPVAHGRTA